MNRKQKLTFGYYHLEIDSFKEIDQHTLYMYDHMIMLFFKNMLKNFACIFSMLKNFACCKM
jgi:hypothetical protein